jgi:hypothetical protein
MAVAEATEAEAVVFTVEVVAASTVAEVALAAASMVAVPAVVVDSTAVAMGAITAVDSLGALAAGWVGMAEDSRDAAAPPHRDPGLRTAMADLATCRPDFTHSMVEQMAGQQAQARTSHDRRAEGPLVMRHREDQVAWLQVMLASLTANGIPLEAHTRQLAMRPERVPQRLLSITWLKIMPVSLAT